MTAWCQNDNIIGISLLFLKSWLHDFSLQTIGKNAFKFYAPVNSDVPIIK
jgi:hypothetical protein